MTEAKYFRTGNKLVDTDGKSVFPEGAPISINKAKRKSRELQIQNGGLGQGSVRTLHRVK